MKVAGWFDVATFASGFQADIAISRLEAAGIRAVRDDNDTVGIFGPARRAKASPCGCRPRCATTRSRCCVASSTESEQCRASIRIAAAG